MLLLSELTLEKAAALIALRAQGTVKQADLSTELSRILSPPTVEASAIRGAHTSPGYGAIRDGLLGAGLGAGAGALSSYMSPDESKRKRWMSRMLQGGLAGGALAGGVSAAARYGSDYLASKPESAANQMNRDAIRAQINEVTQHGGTAPPELYQQLKQLDGGVTGPPVSPFLDRLRAARMNVGAGDYGTAAQQIMPEPVNNLVGGAMGYGAGAGLDQLRHNATVGDRIRGLETKAFTAQGVPAAEAAAIKGPMGMAANTTSWLGLRPASDATMFPGASANTVNTMRNSLPPTPAGKTWRRAGGFIGAALPSLFSRQLGTNGPQHNPAANGAPPAP